MRIHRLILSWQKQNSIAICQQFGLKTGIASYKMQQIEGGSNKYSICIYVVQHIFSIFLVLFSFAFYSFHTVWCGWNVWVLKDYNIGHFHLAMNEMKTILLNIIAEICVEPQDARYTPWAHGECVKSFNAFKKTK